MPTGGKGSGGSKKPSPAQRRALEQLAAKARASRQQAKVTERKAQHVNEKPKQKPMTGVEKALGFRTVQQSGGKLPPADVFAKTIKDLGEAAYYTPGGIYALGKGIGKDVAATKHGDVSFKRTRAMGKTIGKQTAESFEHPLRHPGYSLLNALAAATAGAGAAARIGAGASALRAGEGVGAALARPGFKGGSLAHKPIAKEIPLPGGAQALQPDNPLLRPLHRARMKKITRQIETGAPSHAPRAVQRHVSAEHVVGRELRAREIVQSDIANAPIEAARRRLKKLTPEEHTAMRVLAIEGKHALRHPAETVQRHIDTHLRYAEEGIEPKLNREIAKDLAKAQHVLEERPRHFLEAAAAARRVGRVSERQLIGGGHLEKSAAKQRLAKIAAEYGRKETATPKEPLAPYISKDKEFRDSIPDKAHE